MPRQISRVRIPSPAPSKTTYKGKSFFFCVCTGFSPADFQFRGRRSHPVSQQARTELDKVALLFIYFQLFTIHSTTTFNLLHKKRTYKRKSFSITFLRENKYFSFFDDYYFAKCIALPLSISRILDSNFMHIFQYYYTTCQLCAILINVVNLSTFEVI